MADVNSKMKVLFFLPNLIIACIDFNATKFYNKIKNKYSHTWRNLKKNLSGHFTVNGFPFISKQTTAK